MALTRKARRAGGSLVVAVPHDLAQEAGLVEGDSVEWQTVDSGVWRLRRVQEAPR